MTLSKVSPSSSHFKQNAKRFARFASLMSWQYLVPVCTQPSFFTKALHFAFRKVDSELFEDFSGEVGRGQLVVPLHLGVNEVHNRQCHLFSRSARQRGIFKRLPLVKTSQETSHTKATDFTIVFCKCSNYFTDVFGFFHEASQFLLSARALNDPCMVVK